MLSGYTENFVTVRDTIFHFSLDVCFIILFSVTGIKLLKCWSKNNHSKKENILHHLVDSIVVKRHCPCQGLAYCVLPQVTCLMNTKYRWFLKPDGKVVRMRHLWGVWDGQVKRNLQVKAILVIINGNIKDPGEVILEFRSFSKTWQRPFPLTTHN